jgi:hypothetical protein
MAQILRQADTLELTGPQADSIAILNRQYTIKLDSLWTPVAKYWAGLPDHYDEGEAYERYQVARRSSVDALIKIVPQIRAMLTDAQMRKLPTFVTPFLDTRYLASIRTGTAGGGFGGPTMMMGGPGMALPAGGAGGGGMTIIRMGTP